MNDLAAQGKAIIMISSEMAELLGMSDRVYVMCDGKLRGEITEKEEMTQAKVMSLRNAVLIGGEKHGKEKTEL